MKTLKEIFEGGAASAPYNTALKVQVCGVGDVVNYKNSSGELWPNGQLTKFSVYVIDTCIEYATSRWNT